MKKRNFYIGYIFACLLCCSNYTIAAEPLVLLVDVKFTKLLALPNADDCREGIPVKDREDHGGDTICWQFADWKLYVGKVKRVISGQYKKGAKIEFALLQHVPISPRYSRNMYVVLQELDTERANTMGTRFFTEDYSFPKEVVCFTTSLESKRSLYKTDEDEPRFCYEKSVL